jgi:hypothetical protein
MSYDEFYDKLCKLKAEFQLMHNREIQTIEELQKLLDAKLARKSKGGLKSLRGLNL